MNRNCPILAIVVPCYNEEAQLPSTIKKLSDLLENLIAGGQISAESQLVFVDDGSQDKTWEIIEQVAKLNPRIHGIKFAANAGHQAAILAGLMETREQVDCSLTIDADLQHDIGVIPEMLNRFKAGKDIITGVRQNRAGDPALKGFLSNGYYWAMKKMGTPLQPQHADFRLIGRNVLDVLATFPERNLFLRGIIAALGFNSDTVPFIQNDRAHGQSKYTFLRSASLAWRGITSFSHIPLRISVVLGLITFALAVLMATVTIMDWYSGNTIAGWSSIMVTVLFLGAIQLFCIAILGEYLARIYIEVKGRPHYVVQIKI